MSPVPVIETARLRLRGFRADDLDARVALGADPGLVRLNGGVPQGREECWIRLQRYAGHWALAGHGLFALEERATGRLIGEAGLARFERGLGPDFDGAPEAAWVLAAHATGRGLATEAVVAALGWHGARHGPCRTVCMIAPDNPRSLALADRTGFRRFRDARYHDRPVVLLERPPLAPGGEPG